MIELIAATSGDYLALAFLVLCMAALLAWLWNDLKK